VSGSRATNGPKWPTTKLEETAIGSKPHGRGRMRHEGMRWDVPPTCLHLRILMRLLAHTALRVVLVSEDNAYVPFSIQDLLARSADPVEVVVATGLTASEATAIIEKHSR
jgi:hypothetical protein